MLFYRPTGRQYDKIGNVSPWWTDETIAAFDERAQCFVDMKTHTKKHIFAECTENHILVIFSDAVLY